MYVTSPTIPPRWGRWGIPLTGALQPYSFITEEVQMHHLMRIVPVQIIYRYSLLLA